MPRRRSVSPILEPIDQIEFDALLRQTFEEIRRGWPALPIMDVYEAMNRRRAFTLDNFRERLENGLGVTLPDFEMQRATAPGIVVHGLYLSSLVKKPTPSTGPSRTAEEWLNDLFARKS